MNRSFLSRFKHLIKRVFKNRWAFRSIGILIFILILFRIDLEEAVLTLASVDLRFVLLSLFIQGLAMLVATFRWGLIMRRLDIDLSFWRTFIFQLIGTSAALVTPGQLGEFIKVLYLKKDGYPVPDSFFSVVIDRVSDLLMLLFFGLISLAILFGLPPQLTLIIAGISFLTVTLGFLFFRNKDKSAVFAANLLKRMSPAAYKEVVHRDAHRLTRKMGEFSGGFLLAIGALTVGNYILLLFRVYAIVLALHLVVPLWYFILVVPLLRLVGLLPISILGLGTRDAASIYLFGQVGVSPTSALLISTLGLFTLQIQAILGLFAWWQHPLRLSEEGVLSLKNPP